MKASLEVSKSNDVGVYKTAKSLWKAFWLGPHLEEHSSVESFKDIYKNR